MPATLNTAKKFILIWLSNIRLSFRRIFTYSGRATRAEFWGLYLLYTVYSLRPWVARWLSEQLTPESRYYLGDAPTGSAALQGISWGISIIFLLTLLSLAVRRLRDAGFSVWWVALYPALRLVTYLVAQLAPARSITIEREDGSTTLFIQTAPVVLLCQLFTTLSLFALLILCLRKSREGESASPAA